jgi:hypothetical protein
VVATAAATMAAVATAAAAMIAAGELIMKMCILLNPV